MGKGSLGELEHQAMLALLRLGEDSHTAPVVQELETRTGRRTTVATVYVILRRLEDKGLVRSVLRAPAEKGGRDRRCFEVTPEGKERLREAQAAYQALWSDLDLGSERAR